MSVVWITVAAWGVQLLMMGLWWRLFRRVVEERNRLEAEVDGLRALVRCLSPSVPSSLRPSVPPSSSVSSVSSVVAPEVRG